MFLHYLLFLLIPAQIATAARTFACGQHSPTSRIFGGAATELDEFPWMALLQYKRGRFQCGGALINSRYVLTAAHCIKRSLIGVRLGEYDTRNETDYLENSLGRWVADPPVDIPIEEKIKHEGYREETCNKYNDIALLRLKEEVVFSDFIQPICLPTQDLPVWTGEKLYVAGWGNIENNTSSDVKLKVDVPLRNNSYCEDTYRQFDFNLNLTSSHWCAGGVKGKDSCRGDSGGPLMKRHVDERKKTTWYAVGIISLGLRQCGRNGWGGVYTKVSSHLPWIDSKIQ